MKKVICLILTAALVWLVVAQNICAKEVGGNVTVTGITPVEGIYGDTNGDARVDAGDALIVLKVAVKKVTLNEQTAPFADVDGDGMINATDALLILKFAVGKVKTLPTFGDSANGKPMRLTVKTADSKMVMEAADGGLQVTSLKTAAGKEMLDAPSAYALPDTAVIKNKQKTIAWKLKSVKADSGKENGVAYECGVITYENEENMLALTVIVMTRPFLKGPFEIRSRIENKQNSDLRIQPGSFASVTVQKGGDLVSIKKESGMAEGYRHYNGSFYSGTGIYHTPADETANVNAWVNTSQDFNSSGFLPMVYQDKTDCGVYCALEWSSGRVLAKGGEKGITFSVDMDVVSRSGGRFATNIPAKEALDLPPVYLGAYDGSLDAGSNLFKRWFFACKVPAKLRDDPNEPLSQMDMQTGLDTHHVESIKWDYGWWSNDSLGNWKSQEGSWELRSNAYKGVLKSYGCTTMAEFGKKIKDKGLNWTVYLLLHDTLDANGIPTDAYGEFNSVTHPDWFSNRLVATGMGRSADLGNVDCVNYLKKALPDFFNKNNVSTWRTDFEPICYGSDLANRHTKNGTDVMYWNTVGFRDIINELYDKVDGFRYESCSSGGSMKDLFTATLAVSINTDDCANYMGMRSTFYDSSYVIHPAQLQFPCNTDFFNTDMDIWPVVETTAKEGFDLNKTLLDMGFRTMCMGSPMFSSWNVACKTGYYDTYATMYINKIRPLIRDGELYHILPRPDGIHYDGVMYADADSSNKIKGLVFLFKPDEQAGNSCHLKLQGLNPKTTYQLTFEDRPAQNCTATGEKLMTDGLDVSIPYVGSDLIWITEAAK